MQYARIQNLEYINIEQLTYSQLETLIRSSTDLFPHNTYRKLNEKTLDKHQGLFYHVMQFSIRNNNIDNSVSLESSNEIHNTYNKLRERTTAEQEGLNYSILEQSIRDRITNGTFKIMKPSKNYKANIELIKKYIMKVEV